MTILFLLTSGKGTDTINLYTKYIEGGYVNGR